MKDTIKSWYNNEKMGNWYHNNELIKRCVIKGTLTAEDYKEITGEDYDPSQDSSESEYAEAGKILMGVEQ